MDYRHLVWSGHAIRQMFQRKITKDEVKAVIDSGETIADYADDRPYPSRLLLGYVGARCLHVVAANDTTAQTVYVITAYEPDITIWNADFRTRK